MILDKRVNIDLNAITKRVLEKREKQISDLNRAQLSRGKKSDGSRLPDYKKSYLKTRRKYGRSVAPMDLRLTGEFYSKFMVNYASTFMEMGSLDGKGPVLEEMFGSLIYGLTEESKNYLLDNGVRDEIVNEVKNELFR